MQVLAVAFVASTFCMCGLSHAATNGRHPSASSVLTRTFRMGFIPFPPDTTPQAAEEVAQFIRGNADIVAQHMESVPWTEALNGATVSSEYS